MAEAAACAEGACQLLPGDSPFWRWVVSAALGQVYLPAGSVSRAAQAFGAAGRLGTGSDNLTARVAVLHRQRELLSILGQPLEANRTYPEALGLATRRGADLLPALMPVHLGLGLLRYEWNDLCGAEGRLADARRRRRCSWRWPGSVRPRTMGRRRGCWAARSTLTGVDLAPRVGRAPRP
jgi:hypothetical protein